MVDIALASATAGVAPVGLNNLNQGVPNTTLVAVTAGAAVIIDPTTGQFALARGTTAPLGRIYGLTLRAVGAGYPVTVMRSGLIGGWVFDALDFDDPVYLSDTAGGLLSTTAGTVPIVVGHIVPARSTPLGATFDKLLELLPVYYV